MKVVFGDNYSGGMYSGGMYSGGMYSEGKYSDGKYSDGITFTQAVDLAVSASTDLHFEKKSQKLRERAWVLGVRNFLPRLSIGVQENDRLQELSADSFFKNYSINIEQLLWDGGRLSMSRKLEKMELDILNSRLDRMADDIVETVLSVYHSVLSVRTIIEIKDKAIEYYNDQRRILKKEVELGLALPLDLAEMELAITEANIERISLELDLVDMERQFADLLGLEHLPDLKEKIDIERSAILPPLRASIALAEKNNSDLEDSRYLITKRQAELKYASRQWMPSFKISGGFGLTGQNYPLNRYNWSVGLIIEFAHPWLQNTFAFQRGLESPNDHTAILQNSASPLPDPAAGLGKRQAALALDLEREKYNLACRRIGFLVERSIEKCHLADQKRILSLEAIDAAARRYKLEETRLDLGQITRIDLMEAHLAYTEMEITAVQAAINLLAAERELEHLLALRPGELELFAISCNQGGSL